MVARKRKSKRHSSGRKSKRPRKGFTLYLCQNLDFDELAHSLDRANIRYKRHRHHFAQWIEDETLLRFVGGKRWVLVTTDQHQRTKRLEKHQIRQHKVRAFVFTSGEMGKDAICNALLKAKNRMRNICRDHEGPFVASISKGGEVRLRILSS